VRNWVLYEAGGHRHWVYRTPPQRSAEVAVDPDDLPARWLDAAAAPVVHVAATSSLAAAERLVDALRRRRRDATVTLDTHEDWDRHARARVRALAAQVDVFAPSREELAVLLGDDDPERALAELRGWGVRAAVVKLGAQGALCWDGGATAVLVPAPAGPAVDTTGAGDAFCGGLAAGLALGLDLVEAARRGAGSAGIAIAGSGSLRLAGMPPPPAEALPPATQPIALPAPAPDPYDIELMRREAGTIPEVIAAQLGDPGGAARALAARLARDRDHGRVEHVYLVGCGDSGFAGMATALAFTRRAGVRAEAVHALDLARYRVRYLPKPSVVVCVSWSGRTGRTIEAAAQARAFGHQVVALTGDPDSPLAAQADELLPLGVPGAGTAPGTSTYAAMLARLLDLAARWGGGDRADLERAPALAAATAAACRAACERAAALLAGHAWVAFLGGGPNEGSARFGAAKLVEAAQVLGVATNLEEWAHEEYFVTGPGAPVVVVAPSGACSDRAGEILKEVAFLGATPIVLSDRPPPPAALHVPLAAGLPEELSPLLAALPLSLIGFHLAQATGKRSYNFASEEAAREHYDTIHRATRGEPA
jgi:glucosamine--fructose-6-phosphate aminotransferase (isomerizing)